MGKINTMHKQLSLFPELALKLVSTLDEKAEYYARHNLPADGDVSLVENAISVAYKDGASAVLKDVIDLLKKYTDLHES
jgi:hypothetical protein